MKRGITFQLFALIFALFAFALSLFNVITSMKAQKVYACEPTVIYHEDGHPAPVYDEFPDEGERIAEAVISSIGTADEVECVGFDATKVMKIITAEAGHDEELCRACTQALQNACISLGNKFPADHVAELYQYAAPATWVSEEAFSAVCDIFIRGQSYDAIEGATLFYNPMFGISDFHEGQQFITEINGVKFYEEVSKP